MNNSQTSLSHEAVPAAGQKTPAGAVPFSGADPAQSSKCAAQNCCATEAPDCHAETAQPDEYMPDRTLDTDKTAKTAAEAPGGRADLQGSAPDGRYPPVFRQTAARRSIPYPADRRDSTFALIFLLLGVLCPFLYLGFDKLLGKAVWLLGLLAALAGYARAFRVKPSRWALLLLVITAALSAQYAFISFSAVTLLCGPMLAVLLPLTATALFDTGLDLSGRHTVFDYLNAAFVRPFSNLGAIFRCCSGKRGNFKVLAGLLIAFPFFAAAVLLLGSDAAFSALLSRLFARAAMERLPGDIARALFGALISVYLFGMAYGARCTRGFGITGERADRINESMKRLPQATAVTALAALAALYLFYLSTQLIYLVSAFRSVLPAGYGLAEYARAGFFELCLVAFMNILLTAGVRAFTSPSQAVKWLATGILLFSLILCGTVTAKIFLYIGSWGLTMLRLMALFAVAVIALTLAGLLYSLHTGRTTARFVLAYAAILLLAFVWSDPDYQIARYNLAKYQSCAHQSLDTDYLVYTLEGRAYTVLLPYLDAHEETLGVSYRTGESSDQLLSLLEQDARAGGFWESPWRWNLGHRIGVQAVRTYLGRPR